MESISAAIYDALIKFRTDLRDALFPEGDRRLTHGRVLVLALMTVSSDRPDMRRMAREIRDGSRHRVRIRRVHHRLRFLQMVNELHDLGLLRKEGPPEGPHQYSLEPAVREIMEAYLQRARDNVANNVAK